jgi:uncharacterized protein (TIGR02391 family)
MKLLRPMSNEMLKKLLLKTMVTVEGKTGPLGLEVNIGKAFRVDIPRCFSIKPLSDIEYSRGLHVVPELIRDGYIERPPDTKFIVRLTRKGYRVARKEIEEMILPSIALYELRLSLDLVAKISDNYVLGDFEDVVFKAFKFLEERVRAKAELPASVIGTELIDKALNEKTGKLKSQLCINEAERHGLHMIFRGAVAFFKNPSSHRTVLYEDPNKLMHILGFANFLLDIVDKCQLVKTNK